MRDFAPLFPSLFASRLGNPAGSIDPLVNYLSSLVQDGGVYWPFDDTGAFSRAINPALALGRNLVINGDFATDTIWTKGTGWTIAGGVAVATAATGDLTQSITGLVTGKSYEVTFTISGYVSGSVQILVGSGSTSTTRNANGTYTATIVCVTNTTLNVHVVTAFTGNIDDVSCKQVSIPASTSFPSAELLVDGNMETAGVAAWTAVNSATLTKETASPHGGAQVLRIARNGSNNPGASQTILTVGKTYRVTGYCRSDGSASPRVQDSVNTAFTGTTSTSWQAFDVIYIGGGTALRLVAITSTGTQYVEFDDVSITEVNPLTGVISGALVNQDAGPRLLKAYSFDGVNDFTNVYSADLNSVFNPDAGTLIVFIKLTAGVWTDATTRYFAFIGADTSANYVLLGRNTTNNTLRFAYRSGGAAEKQILSTAVGGSVAWNMMAVTWDKAADQVKANINGAQVGSTLTGLSTWVGNLSTINTVIGAINTSGTNPGSGLITHPFLATRAYTDAELLLIAQRGGVAA